MKFTSKTLNDTIKHMHTNSYFLLCLRYCFLALLFFANISCENSTKRILVFSKTAGFRHKSIKDGKLALLSMGKEKGIKVDTTEDASYFCEDSLKRYSCVVFLNTTGDILDPAQQVDFQRYIQSGGGFVGIHAASDTEYEWPWFVSLIGGNFASHPEQQQATIIVKDKSHPSTSMLPDAWSRFDEWYNFKNLSSHTTVLATLDESTYKGGQHNGNHPLIWFHEFDGGRAFYTACGHTEASYAEPLFLQHVWGGIEWAIGDNKRDYKKAYSQRLPEANRFVKTVIKDNLNEPMALDIASDGTIYYVERRGGVFRFNARNGIVKQIAKLKVEEYAGFGLLSMVLDPDFTQNKHMYLHYNLPSKDNATIETRVSRFTLKDGILDINSEKIIYKYYFDYEPGAHTGSTLLFDKKGYFYISIGDNTPPWQANGFPPMDERPDRKIYDAQRTSANTHDPRGKILRIIPRKNGGYDIPEGNLFDKNGKEGLAEIYIMGCRNPWRMSIDKRLSVLYWGEVGPDAGKDSTIGPKGYDEINRAEAPGNYGWPYFVANNLAYAHMNLVNNEPGIMQSPTMCKNLSPNNTGSAQVLPPAKPATIYYPYAKSDRFPDLGTGGRTACAGPVYYYNDFPNAPYKLPIFFDSKLLIFDWIRDWIMAVQIDANGNLGDIVPAFPNLKFDHPTFLKFAPDGSLWVLEYGFVWYNQNKNARLSRVQYFKGNRPPIVKILASDTVVAPGTKIQFNANVEDLDNDNFTVSWYHENGKLSATSASCYYIYTTAGIYFPTIKVKDEAGNETIERIRIVVGNTYPKIQIIPTSGNRSFFWPGSEVGYVVQISDKEDVKIDSSRIEVYLEFIPEGADEFPKNTVQAHTGPTYTIENHPLISKSDCKACHALDKKSVGPSFQDIAQRYTPSAQTYSMLAKKIIKGGYGVWGDHAMSAHPNLSQKDAEEMVAFILTQKPKQERSITKIQPSGKISIPASVEKGTYILSAKYTDKGSKTGKGILSAMDRLQLKRGLLMAETYDTSYKSVVIVKPGKDGKAEDTYLGAIQHETFFAYRNIHLKSLARVTLRVNSKDASGTMRMRRDGPTGPILASFKITPAGTWEVWSEVESEIMPTDDVCDVYFTFEHTSADPTQMLNVDWIKFDMQHRTTTKALKRITLNLNKNLMNSCAKNCCSSGSSLLAKE